MVVAGALGQHHREPQLVQPPVHGTGPQRRAAGVEIGPHRRRGGRHPGVSLRRRIGQRPADLRGQRQAQFLPVEVPAFGDVLAGPAVFAQGHERLDQDGIAVRVEGVPLQRQRRQLHSLARNSRSEGSKSSFVQQGLDHVVQAVALVRQPRVEDRGIREGQPLQQLAAERPRVNARAAGRVHHLERIAAPWRLQRKPQRIAGHRHAVERPAQLGQVPAERAERVRGIREEQRRRAGAAGAVRLQREVGKHGPGLAASGLQGSRSGGLDRGRTEEPNPVLGHTAHATAARRRRLRRSHARSHARGTH